MGKFHIHESETGKFTFRLAAVNGETIAISQAYTSKESCKKGIESVKKNAPIAAVEDQTVEGSSEKHPKYEVYSDHAGEFRFRLTAANGENIIGSQGYVSKESCKKGVASVQANAAAAEIAEG
ncbi:MAG: YegP family protein [Raoultibacter sp.]